MGDMSGKGISFGGVPFQFFWISFLTTNYKESYEVIMTRLLMKDLRMGIYMMASAENCG